MRFERLHAINHALSLLEGERRQIETFPALSLYRFRLDHNRMVTAELIEMLDEMTAATGGVLR